MTNRLWQVWLALTGKLNVKEIFALRKLLEEAEAKYRHQLSRANEAVKLYNDGEVGRKAASDALGSKVISELRRV